MTWNPQEIADWILTGGSRMPDLDTLTQALGAKLVEAGAPVWRLRLAMRTVHPLVTAVSTKWERETGPQEVFISPHGLEQRDEYEGSPMAVIAQSEQAYRRDLTKLPANAHESLLEQRARGATDYYGLPLVYGDHMSGIMIVVTDRADGFGDEDIAGLEQVARTVSAIVEVNRLKTLSTAVGEAYLGQRAGRRVLGGEITRGHVDRIDAAILVSDLRGWTRLNTELDVADAVAIANRYFEIMDDAVSAQGGEILKFMGDGVLAVFPADADHAKAAGAALAAAQMATAQQTDTMRFGIGLHIGNVLYGNIGSEQRLDFTVLGSAVNLTARIEALSGETGRAVLLSDQIAGALQAPVEPVGAYDLKGLPAPVEVWAPVAT